MISGGRQAPHPQGSRCPGAWKRGQRQAWTLRRSRGFVPFLWRLRGSTGSVTQFGRRLPKIYLEQDMDESPLLTDGFPPSCSLIIIKVKILSGVWDAVSWFGK